MKESGVVTLIQNGQTTQKKRKGACNRERRRQEGETRGWKKAGVFEAEPVDGSRGGGEGEVGGGGRSL